jgi:hypothetical protein
MSAAIAEPMEPRACTPIKNVNQLQAMQNNLAGDYCLVRDIEAGNNPNFAPIGNISTPFTGKLNGNGHVVRNLRIKSNQQQVGLFGVTRNAVISNLTIENVSVTGTSASLSVVGGLAGSVGSDDTESTTIANVHVSGSVKCLVGSCDVGGILGGFGSFAGENRVLRDSSSSATVIGSRFVGGIVGFAASVTIRRTYATGPVRCTATNCMAAGLVARFLHGAVGQSFATGAVEAADGSDSRAGGLVAYSEGTASITKSFAEGPVRSNSTGPVGYAAAVIAQHNGSGPLDQVYGVGPVTSAGATTAGVTASAFGPVTNAYWDTQTTGQATSNAGTGMTTAQLRAALPTGFDPAIWGITPNLSYPFLLTTDINFVAPLATLVRNSKVFAFLPISQHDDSQYNTPPADSKLTALATVYTMIARAIGIAQNVPSLTDVPIDRYFWDEATQKTKWRGPVKDYATLGTLTTIAAGTPIEAANVIGAMDNEQLVILRGRYVTEGGDTATHWMLGTLYREDTGGNPVAVLAHDPWTGQQVTIDPATKRVVTPEDFPLENFRVNGYQPVTVN